MFAHAHDLRIGSMLVFRYDGRSELTITVFNHTTCHNYYSDNTTEGTITRLLPIAKLM
jgi:hypothetical protein